MLTALKYWLPAILYMALIFFMSTNPAPEEAKAIPYIGPYKIVHLVEYGILSLLYFYALHRTTTLTLFKKLVYSIVFTYAYGVFDEVHQSFNPQRSAAVIDTVANFFGALGMQSSIWSIYKIRRKT